MKQTENFLGDVPNDKFFWVCDGQIIRNLNGLVTSLGKMNNGTFTYHVNKEKNDFSTWVKEVIGDNTLARELKKRKSKASTIKTIKERIRKLKK